MVVGWLFTNGQGLAMSSIRLMAIITAASHDRRDRPSPRRNHGVERKDSVQHHDLRDHRPEFRPLTLGRVGAYFPFQPFVEPMVALKSREEAAEQHNQIAGAEA